ncbi:MAG: PLP-dependent cysteine synthase family protein [Candidatus Moraniibacteriota bacterium]
MYNNVIEMIGNTPMIKLNNITNDEKVEIFAKLEGQNPSGSIKDRIALAMIEQAEKDGSLTKDKIIIEPTSGNTGIALAMIGAVKGYRVHVVMSKAVSMERRKMIEIFGADVILTDGKDGTDGAIRRAHEIVQENSEKYFMPNQFSNEYNKLAHYKTTAKEIWEQMDGRIDYFVSALGTSGTIMGVGKGLKEFDKDIKIVEAQPVRGHYIQGLKNMQEAIVPEIYDDSQIDISIKIDSENAFKMARNIMKKEGISVGMSSGAVMDAVTQLFENIKINSRIVVIFPDRGEKYASTVLFN